MRLTSIYRISSTGRASLLVRLNAYLHYPSYYPFNLGKNVGAPFGVLGNRKSLKMLR